MAKNKGVSLKPSDAVDDKKKLATSLRGISFGAAIDTQWWGVGRRDDRRMATKAPLFYLKTAIQNVKPVKKSFNYMERLVSLGGCDLAIDYPPRKSVDELFSNLSFLLDEIADPLLFQSAYDFTQSTTFRWNAKIAPLTNDRTSRIEVWSPFVKEVYGDVGKAFFAPSVTVCQVFQSKWLLDNALLKDRAVTILSAVWSEWEKWVTSLITDGTSLLEKARHKRS